MMLSCRYNPQRTVHFWRSQIPRAVCLHSSVLFSIAIYLFTVVSQDLLFCSMTLKPQSISYSSELRRMACLDYSFNLYLLQLLIGIDCF
jgi:hypothetical protein